MSSPEQSKAAGPCECGCGQPTVVSPVTDRYHGWTKGVPRRFLTGHNNHLLRLDPVAEDCGYETPCLIWQGQRNDRGYGLSGRGGHRLAHRAAWVDRNGAVPDGMELDHLCRNRACVNPGHLEVVTHEENMRRSSLALAASIAGESPIAAARFRLGLSRPDVARRLGVSTAMVRLWEVGKYPCPAELDVDSLTWARPYGEAAIRERRAAVLALYREGVTGPEIARRLGVSRGTVITDVRWLRKSGADLPSRSGAFARRDLAEGHGDVREPERMQTFGGRRAA